MEKGNAKGSPTCAIVVSSVDHFSDIWPQFFHFFFKYWPEPAFDVYLITNFKEFNDPRVKTIQLGEDRQWGTNLLQTLDKIPADYILYVQDDYLLNHAVSNETMSQAVAWMHETEVDYLNLFYSGKETVALPGALYEQLTMNNQWVIDLQAAIWSTATLRRIVEDSWTPWDAESELNRYGKSKNAKGVHSLNEQQASQFCYIQAVKGGFWLKEAVEFCREQGVPINLGYRPCPPWGNSFVRKFYRSLIKRKMKLRRQLQAYFPGPQKVEPLKLG